MGATVAAFTAAGVLASPATASATTAGPVTRLVSLPAGAGSAEGREPALSTGGRYVVFSSRTPYATGDRNDRTDVYRRDMRTGRIQWVSVASRWPQDDGSQPGVSGDGNVVVYLATHSVIVGDEQRPTYDVMVRDIRAGVTRRVAADIGDGGLIEDASLAPAISADGRYVAFLSFAPGLVAGAPTRGGNIYRYDLRSGRIRLVDSTPGGLATGGRQPSLSGDGRYVAFDSAASHLVPGDDEAGLVDVFVRDLRTGNLRRFVAAMPGIFLQETSVISADGRSLAVVRLEYDPVQETSVSHLVVYDVRSGVARQVIVRPDGTSAAQGTPQPAISADGRFVAFSSDAPDLVARDTNEQADVFVRDMRSDSVRRMSVGTGGRQSDEPSDSPAISGDGAFVAFHTTATTLAADEPDGGSLDVFLRRR